jgi:type IV secretion system protein VirB9
MRLCRKRPQAMLLLRMGANKMRFTPQPLCFRFYLLGAALALISLFANASESSKNQSKEPKALAQGCPTLATIAYDPNNVTSIRAKLGFVTQVILGANESIIDKRGGDTDGWDVSNIPGQPIITVKPRATAVNSNLIVTTDKHAYIMALNVLPATSPCSGHWQVVYKMPAPPVQMIATNKTPEQLKAEEKMASDLFIKTSFKKDVPESKNWNYSMQAAKYSNDIVPDEIYDDGRFTYIKFNGNRELPSVFKVTADGEEVIVDRHIQGRDVMVIHEVSPRWVLRLDKQTVGLWNDAFDSVGSPPTGGTISSGVERITNGQGVFNE